jgi:uroporphyrin-III C-methyltransferase
VLYDALVTPEMLALCPQAELISVGKRSGQRSTAQEVINEQLVDCARNHSSLVVRLKGGDPMLFGRADEELRALEAEGIEVEVVPGITTAVAAAAATKQPLTKRGVARSVAFFTSSTAPDEPDHPPCPKPTPWCSTWAGAKPPPPPSACWREGRRPTCRWWWWKTAAGRTSASCA